MDNLEEYLVYLNNQRDELHYLIGENYSEYNKGRIYVMDKIIEDLKSWILINEELK